MIRASPFQTLGRAFSPARLWRDESAHSSIAWRSLLVRANPRRSHSRGCGTLPAKNDAPEGRRITFHPIFYLQPERREP